MNRILHAMIDKYPELDACAPQTEAAYEALKRVFAAGGKLLLCGNGGSASDSEHIVGEMMKSFMLERPVPPAFSERLQALYGNGEGAALAGGLQGALPSISLASHTAFLSAYANDAAADMAFAQQVYGYGKPGDALLAISTSGHSANVVKAVQIAKALGMTTIGLTGGSGGKLRELCDIAVCVPYESTPDIQERHLPIYHTLCMMLEEAFFHR
ncbi:phosphoheptose isomerase [Paenibacillus sp. 598K]|uniref:D-sedoheptulose-7-phosphate isomerase n=1 Tax=Paenibacillus sp. 598K TaxID=1117987 RepID=UPI000FFA882E|nr:SIS domain-containing protein [Paenibacillus sp. 598K]GBF75711.1 phosphoheptose isomerase [Paenibacillus sp. 598K]